VTLWHAAVTDAVQPQGLTHISVPPNPRSYTKRNPLLSHPYAFEMASNAPKKTSSLLDALDNTFVSPPAPQPPQTPLKLQNLNTINSYFQPKGSGSGTTLNNPVTQGNNGDYDMHGWDSDEGQSG
jgi:hypothetical protein